MIKLENLFKDLLWDALVEKAIASLFKLFPILGWGPIGAIASLVIKHFATQLYKALSLVVKLELITMRNNKLHRQYTKAAVDLRRVALQSGLESPQFRKARDEHKKYLSDFVRTRL